MAIAKAVLTFALITEASELFSLYRFSQNFALGTALYQAVYNAIPAFNNSGYSLFSDNLIGYQGDPIVNLTIMGLIVHGGIGFIVQYGGPWSVTEETKATIHPHKSRPHHDDHPDRHGDASILSFRKKSYR